MDHTDDKQPLTNRERILDDILKKVRHAVVPIAAFASDLTICGTTDELKSLEDRTLVLMNSATQLRDIIFKVYMGLVNQRTVDSSKIWGNTDPDPED